MRLPFENAPSAVSVAPNTTSVTAIVTINSTTVKPSSRLTFSPRLGRGRTRQDLR